jgi:hypothetical protein
MGLPKLNPEKFQLFQKDVRHLRYIASPEVASMDPEKLRAARE